MAHKMVLPSRIHFACHVTSARFRDFVEEFLELFRKHGFPEILEWWTANAAGDAAPALAEAVAALPDTAAGLKKGPAYVELSAGKGVNAGVRFVVGEDGVAFCSATVRWVVRAGDRRASLLDFQKRCLALGRDMLRRFDVHSAELRPEGGGAECVPDVALVDRNSHIVVTNQDEVDDLYDDPEAFWGAGWTIAEERDGQRLLARDLDAVAGPEYLARLIDHQGAVARAAKPQETGYESPVVIPEEEDLFRAGDERLHFVGYKKDERLIEYSCALNEGEHIHGWEVYALLDIVEQRKTRDGSPVDTVRIVFLDEWAARQEKRPLLDVGCRVFHYDDDGELRELTE